MSVLYWIVIAIGVLVALKLGVLWAEPRMAFVGRFGPTPPPPGFQRFEMRTPDGVRLTGWRTEIAPEGPVFLYLCGNAGNLSDRTELLARAAEKQMSVLSFNYRGTGESEGRNSEAHAYDDAALLHRYAAETLKISATRLVIWGHSIGGAVAAELALRAPCAGVVLEATFRSARLMARRMMPVLPLHWLMTYRFDNEERVRRLTRPLLFIHGDLDATIPLQDSHLLYGLAKSDKELWVVEGADHNDNYEVAGPQFFDRLREFGLRVTAGAGRLSPSVS